MNEQNLLDFSFIILSAGFGKRMKSDIPKGAVLLKNKPIILHIIDTLYELGINDIITVVGYKKEIIMGILKNKVKYAYQEKQLGTADAVKCALEFLDKNKKSVIIPGDLPLVSKEMILDIIKFHINNKNDFTILSFNQNEELFYGRIIRDCNNKVIKIKEYKELNDNEININEVNSGIYVVNNDVLFDYLDFIDNNNNQNELYFTDIIEKVGKEKKIEAIVFDNSINLIGINDKDMLEYIEKNI